MPKINNNTTINNQPKKKFKKCQLYKQLIHLLFFFSSHLNSSTTQNNQLLLLLPSPLHMRQGGGKFISCNTTTSDGERRLFAVPRGGISTVLGLPSWDSPPLDHHLHIEWCVLLLLPLGEAQILPSIFLGRGGSRGRERWTIFQS